VGQDEAVQAVVDLYQVFRAGLNSPGRPVGNLLFLGPTDPATFCCTSLSD
jgi:ATP-dependent Clp protease ATP-binding subunit ClpB